MAEESPENGMNEEDNQNTPGFDETDGPEGKSHVSLLGGNAAGVQVKATIDNFYRLITNHYGNSLRMNEMTGKPEWYDTHRKRWREWTDAQESQHALTLKATTECTARRNWPTRCRSTSRITR